MLGTHARRRMITSSFIQLPGIGHVIEREIWRSGVSTWDGFRAARDLPAVVMGRRRELSYMLGECEERLAAGDSACLAGMLPASEAWRLYPDFRDRAAFLDIETTGLSPAGAEVTMVGVLDRGGYRAFLSGENLRDLPSALAEYRLVVTYNGAAFDLPFLQHRFGRSVSAHMAHIDLMHPLRRLGLRGGLKGVERRLGLDRGELTGLSGIDAVRMWRMWEDGDGGARETLVRYNAEDVASLPAIAEFVFRSMARGLDVETPALAPWEGPRIDHLEFDGSVVARLRRSGPRRL